MPVNEQQRNTPLRDALTQELDEARTGMVRPEEELFEEEPEPEDPVAEE
jgi:hypothetical protein